MKLARKSNTIFDRTLYVLALLAAALIIFIVIAITTQVVLRFLFNRSLIWVIEVTEYSLLFMTLLGAAWVLKEEGHVRIELLLERLDLGTRSILNIITSVIGAIICLIITWYGVKVTWEYFQIDYRLATALKPPSFYLFAVIPLGIFLLFIQFLRRTNRFVGEWRTSQHKNKTRVRPQA